MCLMTSITVLVAEMCLSRLGRLPSSYLRRCPRKMIVARQSVYLSFKYDRYFSDLFSRAHSPTPSTEVSAYKAFPVPVTLYP